MFITVESSNSKRLGQKRWDFIMIPLRETIVTKLSENGMELASILDQVQPCSSIGSKVIKKKHLRMSIVFREKRPFLLNLV